MVGETVYIDPHRPARENDFVVVLSINDKTSEINGVVARFIRRTEENVVVEQLNPQQQKKLDNKSVQSIHVIVGASI